MVTGAGQLSVAVATPVLLVAVESPQANCLSGGQVITGGVPSTKVMVWKQSDELPQWSIAFQVRTTLAMPVQLVWTGASVNVMVTVLQASVAVAVPLDWPQSTEMSGGQNVKTGGVVSSVQV